MDLKDCLKKMDAAGRLAHVHTEVDAVHELSGVAAKLDGRQGGRVRAREGL